VTERLAAWSGRRPWRTVALWLAVLVASVGIVGVFLGDALSGGEELTNRTESRRAYDLQAERMPQDDGDGQRDVSEVVVVRSAALTAQDPRFRRHVADTERAIEAAGARVTSPVEDPERLVAADGRAVALLVALGPDAEDQIEDVVAAVRASGDRPPFDAAITGDFTLDADFTTLAEEDLRDGELTFGIPAALVVLLLVFGSVVAGLVPLLLALVAVVVALALLALVGQAFPLSVFATNMLTAMGLALGIDYSLFVLSRFREERRQGRGRQEAIAATGATASRAVLFSGVAFTFAMMGLLLVPSTIMRSLAAGAIVAGIVSVAAALTLLPALLSLLGDRVDALRIPLFGRGGSPGGSRFWTRAVETVMRRPVPALALVTAVLLALAVPCST
jgi:RND superfamily putative drug exporter